MGPDFAQGEEGFCLGGAVVGQVNGGAQGGLGLLDVAETPVNIALHAKNLGSAAGIGVRFGNLQVGPTALLGQGRLLQPLIQTGAVMEALPGVGIRGVSEESSQTSAGIRLQMSGLRFFPKTEPENRVRLQILQLLHTHIPDHGMQLQRCSGHAVDLGFQAKGGHAGLNTPAADPAGLFQPFQGQLLGFGEAAAEQVIVQALFAELQHQPQYRFLVVIQQRQVKQCPQMGEDFGVIPVGEVMVRQGTGFQSLQDLLWADAAFPGVKGGGNENQRQGMTACFLDQVQQQGLFYRRALQVIAHQLQQIFLIQRLQRPAGVLGQLHPGGVEDGVVQILGKSQETGLIQQFFRGFGVVAHIVDDKEGIGKMAAQNLQPLLELLPPHGSKGHFGMSRYIFIGVQLHTQHRFLHGIVGIGGNEGNYIGFVFLLQPLSQLDAEGGLAQTADATDDGPFAPVQGLFQPGKLLFPVPEPFGGEPPGSQPVIGGLGQGQQFFQSQAQGHGIGIMLPALLGDRVQSLEKDSVEASAEGFAAADVAAILRTDQISEGGRLPFGAVQQQKQQPGSGPHVAVQASLIAAPDLGRDKGRCAPVGGGLVIEAVLPHVGGEGEIQKTGVTCGVGAAFGEIQVSQTQIAVAVVVFVAHIQCPKNLNGHFQGKLCVHGMSSVPEGGEELTGSCQVIHQAKEAALNATAPVKLLLVDNTGYMDQFQPDDASGMVVKNGTQVVFFLESGSVFGQQFLAVGAVDAHAFAVKGPGRKELLQHILGLAAVPGGSINDTAAAEAADLGDAVCVGPGTDQVSGNQGLGFTGIFHQHQRVNSFHRGYTSPQ